MPAPGAQGRKERGVERGLNEVEKQLRVEADDYAGGDEEDCADAFGEGDGRERRMLGGRCDSGFTEEGLLHGAPDVDDSDDDAEADEEGEQRVAAPGADQDHEFGDEAAEAGQSHTGHAGDDEGGGGEGDGLLRDMSESWRRSRVWVRA